MPQELTLTQWRNIRGFTQEQLAESTGISERSIWNYENISGALDKASYTNISKICKVLEISPSQIFLPNTSE